MHLLGRPMTAVARLPDGSTRELVHVPNEKFNWQDDYRFTAPFRPPKDTVIEVEAIYDNSENNLFNPGSPPQRVTRAGRNDERNTFPRRRRQSSRQSRPAAARHTMAQSH
jgi:hypothetical protein